MDEDGCKWMCMGAIGVWPQEGWAKTRQKYRQMSYPIIFWMHGQGEQMSHVGQDDFGVQGGPKGDIKWK